MSKNDFPKILSNIPEGKDLFKAESHQKIANTIISIIENQSNLIEKQIIGLQGDWGTGKSNIIKIIEEKTKDKFSHFTFDTWTHQENLSKSSIVEELFYFLTTTKVINNEQIVKYDTSKKWVELKENLFKKTSLSKNKSTPKIKEYWVFGIISIITYTFLNFIYSEFLKVDFSDTYAFYGGESGKKFWIITLLPTILVVASIYRFLEEYLSRKKSIFDLELIGEMIYIFSGEKLESTTTHSIIENEPENIEFKKFLYAIDQELENKTLIFTIDNIDRLTKEKVKNIWSIINIFFAESNSSIFLKNIWLIIPYDQTKVLKSFDDSEVGLGLLEKTFALTFKVPPPLISNWELFFESCFEKAFEKIKIDEKSTEIEILKKVFHHYEKNITPRKIINFINQVSTYYLQNSTIKLRYFSIVILCNEKLYEGNINENIIDRNKYLNTLDNLFSDDDFLELNLSKIIYGLSEDKDAEEALLLNEIESLLNNNKEFNEKIINIPSFAVYFDKYFRRHIENNRKNDLDDSNHFNIITDVLLNVKDSFLNKNQSKFYSVLWEFYLQELLNNNFTLFNKTYEGVITFCTKRNSMKFIKKAINSYQKIQSSEASINYKRKSEPEYIDFLRGLESFLESSNIFSFNEIELKDYQISIELFLENPKAVKDEFKRYKLTSTDEAFKNFFNDRVFGAINFSTLTKYKEEIISLKDDFKIDFIIEFLSNLKSYKFSKMEEIETMIFFSKKLSTNDSKIPLNHFGNDSLNSFVKLINEPNNKTNDFSIVFMLIFINYSNNGNSLKSNEIFTQLLEKIDKNQVNYLMSEFENFKEYHELINIIKISLQFKEINSLKILSIKLLEQKRIILNQENYNWILQNFSMLSNEIFINHIELFYNLINENSTNFECEIKDIDPELINNSRKKINLRLIKLANEYLFKTISSNSTFFRNQDTHEYKLFNKLLSINKLDNKTYEILQQPFISLILNNWAIPKNQETNLIQIKERLEKTKLNKLIEESIDRISTRSSLFLLSPEVLPYLNKFNNLQKSRALKILIDNPEYYNIELIEYAQNFENKSFTDLLIKNLQNHPNEQIKELAIKNGIIEIS